MEGLCGRLPADSAVTVHLVDAVRSVVDAYGHLAAAVIDGESAREARIPADT